MAYTITSESYGRRLPKITAEADSTDDLIDLGTNYAEGSVVDIGGTKYALDKVQGWVIGGGSETVPKIPAVSFGDSTVIVDTTTVSFAKDGDNAWYISAKNPLTGMTKSSFQFDGMYKVIWDGVEYSDLFYKEYRNVWSNGTTIYAWDAIGNVFPLGYGPNESDAPFCIETALKEMGSEVQIISYDTEPSHTIKIIYVPFSKTVVDPILYEKVYNGITPIRFGSGDISTIEGAAKDASGVGTHAEGLVTTASNTAAHAEGVKTVASGFASHAQGRRTTASGNYSFASGSDTTASGAYSDALGYQTTASGSTSHAEGQITTASASAAHAEGANTTASGKYSHAQNNHTVANHKSQTALGEFNVADPSSEVADERGTYVEIVGNGTAEDARSNARTLDWNGNEELAGSITLGKGTADEVTLTAAQLKALLALLN